MLDRIHEILCAQFYTMASDELIRHPRLCFYVCVCASVRVYLPFKAIVAIKGTSR